MKSFINCLILIGLVVLVGCSGDSPKQPATVTTTTTDVWEITSLDAVPTSNPIVNTTVTIVAAVTFNGSPAPDGSQVEFTANGGVFPTNGQQLITVMTSGGEAAADFTATEVGTYAVQARVKTVTSQINIVFKNPDTSGGLQMWSINPAVGSYAGGETVVLTGKGIRNPVEVFFTVQGIQYQAIVDAVEPSVPLESGGTITIRTPFPSAADTTLTSQADVKVAVGVGTADEESQSYPSVFTYISDSVTIGVPVIFGVEPYYGRSSGGEIVTILGLNFAVDSSLKELEQNFDEVYFTFQGEELLAQVERWSENQIEVITPRFTLTPLENDTNAGVKLTRINGTPIVKNDVFIVKSDIAEPEITGISPTAGPIDGGTIVTINGHGFQLPLQVLFGVLEATDVQLYDDQSLADNDVITCRTPDYSQQGEIPPVEVPVKVTNLQSGKSATSAQNFRYGDLLYISQANPSEGQIGDLFALYGAGFEDPLTVWFRAGGEIRFDVVQVTGTELTLRSPTDLEPTCVDRSGDFRVVLNESGRTAEGGNYTLLGSNPTITSVDPIFVDSINNGNGVVPGEIDIYGVRFADELLVLIDAWTIDPGFVTVETPEHIHVSQIPAPNDFNLIFDTTTCTTDLGFPGIKQVPTGVNVTVRNLPIGCQDTLNETLVYVPEDQTCVAAPEMNVNLLGFPNTTAGSCSPAQSLVINNSGGGDLDIQTIQLAGPYFFDPMVGGSQTAGPLTVPSLSTNATLSVYFCPSVPDGSTQPGVLRIFSNDPANGGEYFQELNGIEATPQISTLPYGQGDSWDFGDDPVADPGCSIVGGPLVITNTGDVPVNIGAITSTDPQFQIESGPANSAIQGGASSDLVVRFCASASGPQSATLSIEHDAGNETSPIAVTMTGNGT